MSWVNRRGEEGAAPRRRSSTIAGSTLLVQPANPPENAAGWNVYVGTTPDAMARQNAAAIATGAELGAAAALATTGRRPGKGQEPNYLKAAAAGIAEGLMAAKLGSAGDGQGDRGCSPDRAGSTPTWRR